MSLETSPTRMASSTQIKALLKSYSNDDKERFLAVALQLAASEARKGHSKFAEEIKELVDKAKVKTSSLPRFSSILPVATPQGEAAKLLEEIHDSSRISDLVLSPSLNERLHRILDEQHNFTRIKEFGLRPRNKLLFTGPPGCGKSMTASAIANELHLPLFVVRLDELITRYLGESLSKLRTIFEAIAATRAVYLFDEFDSIGYSRDSSNDVGEMRRILNSFLTSIERLKSNSLVIAATNHGDRLDKALYRRFDDLIEFGLPTKTEAWNTIERRLDGIPTFKLSKDEILPVTEGLSYAEITRACEESVKELLITKKKRVTTPMLQNALTERRLFLNH